MPQTPHTHMSVCVVCVYIHIYIYIGMCVYIYIYIYIQFCDTNKPQTCMKRNVLTLVIQNRDLAKATTDTTDSADIK